MNERTRRRWASPEAPAIGRGGQALLAKGTGISRRPIPLGLPERAAAHPSPLLLEGRIRRPGGGRTTRIPPPPTRWTALDASVEPTSRGEPPSPWRRNRKRVRKLASAWPQPGFQRGRQQVADLLQGLDSRWQANRQPKAGASPPDRDAPFAARHAQVQAFPGRAPAVVSVDPQKQERGGEFNQGGREGRPQGVAEWARGDDGVAPELGKGIPGWGDDRTTPRVGSGSDGIPRPPNWPSNRGAAGGGIGDRSAPSRRANCGVPPRAAGARRAGVACGRARCNGWRTNCAGGWRVAISRRGPASGIQVSAECSASFRAIGVAARGPATK